jgi:hypothetical protein
MVMVYVALVVLIFALGFLNLALSILAGVIEFLHYTFS